MTTSGPLSTAALLQQLHWRYATKKFDPTRKIDATDWAILEQALVLSASSYGLQPYRFLVIQDPALRTRLRSATFNQPQIVDASHLIVFCAFTDLTEAHVDRFITLTAQARGVPVQKLDGYRTTIIGDLVKGPRHSFIQDWCKRQTYLALGNLLTCAATLGVDACPMEGFSPADFDTILGLKEQHLAATVLCTLGYRSSQDTHAGQGKMRFPREELVVHR